MTQNMSVQVRKGQLRTSPSFLGKIVITVHYGDQVSVVKEKEFWLHVAAKGKKGWIHISALSEKEIVLDPNSTKGSLTANSDELALAGKGFNKQVEEQYRQSHKDINFKAVDRMEKLVVSEKQIQQFLKQGKLHPEKDSV